MTDKHITDNEIQQYVLDKTNCPTIVIDHISVCPTCKAHAKTYRLLFSEIKQQPKPVFDFDLTGLVVASIVHEKAFVSKSSGFLWIPILTGLGIIGSTIYFFGKFLVHVFASISVMAMYLIVITAVLLLALQGIEMLRVHKKQMAALNLN